MYVRLAFSVAIHSDPDIFLVDEVLSVGDEQFQRRCRAKIRELRDSGKTIVFVSHDLNIVNELCDRVILLQGGKIVQKGSPADTVDFYLQSVGSEEGLAFLHAGSLEVVFNNGKLAICSDGHMLTSGHGCHSSIWSRGMWYDSMSAYWFIESRSETELVATGTFTRIPVKQRWQIRLEGASLVQWDIEMESGPGTEISERTLSLMVTPRYTTWFTEEKAGEFPRIDPDDTRGAPVSAPDKQLKIMGVTTGEGQSDLPPLCFETSKRAPGGALQILNSEYGVNARILQLLEVSADSEKQLAPRSDLFVSARMSLGQSPELIQERLRQARHQRAIDTGNLAAVFAGGGIHLVWEGTEITKNLRVFSSIQSGDFWDDSVQGYWQTERISDVELRATGDMRRLPATQTWILNELKDGTIEWKILLDVKERIEAQEMDVSIMLVPEYDMWVTSHETGGFPPITTEAREWTHLTKLFKSSTFVEARCSETHGHNLPPVRLSFGKPRVAAAVNTRHTEMARVIQGLEPYARGSGIFEPGRYELFSGSIAVGEH